MATLIIELDDRLVANLLSIAASQGTKPDEMAARLLRRAIRRAMPRQPIDREALRDYMAAAGEEELADAEMGAPERQALLEEEDRV